MQKAEKDLGADPTDEVWTRRLLSGVRNGTAISLKIALEHGADVNAHDPEHGATALHYAAARQARSVLKSLMKRPELRYLVQDKRGRLPSDLAYAFGANGAIARFLLIKEIQEAKQLALEYPSLRPINSERPSLKVLKAE